MARKQQAVRIDIEQYLVLQEIWEKEGRPIAESVRRAVEQYLKEYNGEKDYGLNPTPK